MQAPLDWTNLLWDVKKPIIELLDYESRCNLRSCSKKDKIHVDATKFVANNFAIYELRSAEVRGKSIIRIEVDDFKIWFIGKKDYTKVERNWNGVLMNLTESKREVRSYVAKRCIDKFLVKNGMLEATRIKITDIKLSPFASWNIMCSHLTLHYTPSGLRWIFQTKQKLESLDIIGNYLYGIGKLPNVMNVAKSLKIIPYNDLDLNDNHLENVNTPDLLLESKHFTIEGVKIALDRFLRIGSQEDCLEILLRTPTDLKKATDVLKRNLEVEKEKEKRNDIEQWVKFKAFITSGFKNTHGIETSRLLYCYFGSVMSTIRCSVWKKPIPEPRMLYPFTENERKKLTQFRL